MKNEREMKKQRDALVDKVKAMINEGYNVKDIAEKLNLHESTVRSCKHVIEE